MDKWKDISDIEIKRVSEKYNVDIAIINNILDMWDYYYAYELMHEYDSSQESEEISITDDWALLSLFYHKNKSAIKSENLKIFEKVVFIPLQRNAESLKLSMTLANLIIMTFLKNGEKKDYFFLDKDLAEEVLEQKHKLGKRKVHDIMERNDLIKNAAHYLKNEKIKSYAPIIYDLLYMIGFAKMKLGTIRQIIKRL